MRAYEVSMVCQELIWLRMEFSAKVVNKSQPLMGGVCVLKVFWSLKLRGQDYLAMPAMGWVGMVGGVSPVSGLVILTPCISPLLNPGTA